MLNTTFYEIGEIMAIEAVPYGNAAINYTNQSVTCQHGPQECSANTYEQCGIYLYPDQNIWFPYYVCLESKGSGEGGGGDAVIAAVDPCATAAGMDPALIHDCHDNATLAWQLQEAAAAATPANHTYTPWVVVGGSLLNHQDLLKRAVCDAYTGTLPAACPGASAAAEASEGADAEEAEEADLASDDLRCEA